MPKRRRRGKRGGGNQSPAAIERRQNQAKALELRQAGATYDVIASHLGLSTRMTAWRLIDDALQRPVDHEAKKLRTLELTRLDRMFFTLWPMAMGGNMDAIDRVLKIMERRTKYLGLDLQPVGGPSVAFGVNVVAAIAGGTDQPRDTDWSETRLVAEIKCLVLSAGRADAEHRAFEMETGTDERRALLDGPRPGPESKAPRPFNGIPGIDSN